MAAEYIASAGNPQDHPVRARDPDVRDDDPQHARPHGGPADAPPDPPARRSSTRRTRPASAGSSSRSRSAASRWAPTGSWSRSTRDPDDALSDAEQQLDFAMFDVDDGRGHRRPRARQGPPRRPRTRRRARRPEREPDPMTRRGSRDQRTAADVTDDAIVVRPAARLRGSPCAARRQVDLAPGAAARAPRRGREPDRERRRRRGRALDGRDRRRARRDRGAGRASAAAGSTTGSCRPAATRSPSPTGVLDCGNSGTTTRLVAGLLAGRPLFAVLDGDASLRRRPMGRIVEPLARDGRAGSRAAAAARSCRSRSPAAPA